jgi:hypothetical protein
MRPHRLITALAAAGVLALCGAPATTLAADASPLADVAGTVSTTVDETAAPVDETVEQTAAPAAETVEQPTAPVARTVDETAAPVAETVDETAAPRVDVAAPSATPVATDPRPAADDEPRPAPAATASTTPTEATAMKGGADPSGDPDGDNARDIRGLGSPAVPSGDGDGGSDGRTFTAAGAAVAATPDAVSPPTLAPPVIAAAAPSKPSTLHTRRITFAAPYPLAAWLRDTPRHRVAIPLSTPGALRSEPPAPRRIAAPDARVSGEPGTVHVESPVRHAPAAASGSSLSGLTAPPPTAASILLLAALAAAAMSFITLRTRPVRPRPVPFISLHERPG